MATVTKPMALDESMNTTESTSRNIADVLAQELSGIASAITGGDNKANKTDIATVESGSTASRAYSVGELVYVNGNLYKVITAIASGATFTVGTNIQSANVSGTVKDALDGITSAMVKIYTNKTLSGNVLTVIKDMPDNSIAFFTQSNNPTNQPTGCSWGSYFIFKSVDQASVFYMDSSHMACSYHVTSTDTTITWFIT